MFKFRFPSLRRRRFLIKRTEKLLRGSLRYCNSLAASTQMDLFPPLTRRQKDIDDLYSLYYNMEKPTQLDLLVDVLNISEDRGRSILSKEYKKFKQPASMEFSIKIIKNRWSSVVDIDDHKFWIKTFQTSPVTLTHHLNLLDELKMPFSYHSIFSFKTISKKTVIKLKEENFIPEHFDFPREIFAQLEAPIKVMDQLPKKSEYETKKLNEVLEQMMKVFLLWQLKIDERKFNVMHKVHYFTFSSIVLQLQSIKILKKYLYFDDKKIRNNPSLLTGVPDYYMEYLNYRGSFNGVDVLDLVKSFPSILRRPLKNSLVIEAILDYIGAKPNYVVLNPCVFTYSPMTLIQRIEYFIKKTSLVDLRLTNNNISYFIYFKKCCKRLEEYEKENGPIKLLPPAFFILSKSMTNDGKAKRIAIVQFLTTFLGLKSKDSYRALDQVGLIHYPYFGSIKENFVYLINKGFSENMIRNSFHLLIYPHQVLVDVFENELTSSNYAEEFDAHNNPDKFLQFFLYRVNKMCVNLGGSHV